MAKSTLKKTEIEMQLNGCWICTNLSTNQKGYPRVWDEKVGKQKTLHRVVMERKLNRLLTPDEHVLHSCDTPACCRPSHLTLGTNQDNVDDKVSKGRWGGYIKLSQEQVKMIRHISDRGYLRPCDIARKFGVNPQTVRDIISRKLWKNI